MKNEILKRIHDAIARGPAASGDEDRAPHRAGGGPGSAALAPPDPQLARLVPRDMPRDNVVALFMVRAASAGALVHRARDAGELARIIREILPAKSLVAQACAGRLQKRLGIAPVELIPHTCSLLEAGLLTKDRLFRIDAAITEADAAIAETGSIVLAAADCDAGTPGQAGGPAGAEARAAARRARHISLVALIHIALVWPDQIVPDLLDWTASFGVRDIAALPAGATLITGPSKTADIETKLVQGVHGPAAMHVVVVG